MEELLRDAFPFVAIATWLIVPLYAAHQRGRSFAISSGRLMRGMGWERNT